jgi:uncharacterized protein YdbL (DUF1318 family)
MKRISLLWIATIGLAAAPAAAQSPAVAQAIRAGQAGERFDGYMGYLSSAPAEVRRQVNAINIRRRKLYIGLASRRNVTAEIVGLATACELFTQLAAGEAYMLNDGVWRRRAAGQAAPVPSYCR